MRSYSGARLLGLRGWEVRGRGCGNGPANKTSCAKLRGRPEVRQSSVWAKTTALQIRRACAGATRTPCEWPSCRDYVALTAPLKAARPAGFGGRWRGLARELARSQHHPIEPPLGQNLVKTTALSHQIIHSARSRTRPPSPLLADCFVLCGPPSLGGLPLAVPAKGRRGAA